MKPLKALLTLCLMVVTGPSTLASLAVVQAQRGVATSTTAITDTLTSTATAGNLLVVICGENANNSSTITMSATGGTPTWAQTSSGYTTQSTTDRGGMFFAMNIPSGVTAVTCTWSGSLSARINMVVYEISGAATTSAEDSSVNATNANDSSFTSGSLTTTNANDLLIFGYVVFANITADTAGSGFAYATNGDADSASTRVGMNYEIVSATQSGMTTTTTWTTNTVGISVFAAFKAAAGGSPLCTNTIALTGVGCK